MARKISVRRRDAVEKCLGTHYRCARDIAEKLGYPIPTVTSALSTLYEMDARIEMKMLIPNYHKRPVKHYRIGKP